MGRLLIPMGAAGLPTTAHAGCKHRKDTSGKNPGLMTSVRSFRSRKRA